MTETLAPAADVPAAPSSEGAAPATDPAARIVEIEGIRDTNIDEYNGKQLGDELLALLRQAEEGGAPESNETDVESEPSELTADDLALIDEHEDVPELSAEERAEHVPEDASGYLTPEIGETWSAEDQAGLQPYLEILLDRGTPQGVVDGLVANYQAQKAVVAEADKTSATNAKAELAQSWGGQFQENIDAIKAFLASEVPEQLGEAIATARAADGRRLLNDPAFVSMLLQVAQSSTPQPSTAGSEEAELTALMHNDLDTYNFGRWRGTDQRPCDRLLEIKRGQAPRRR